MTSIWQIFSLSLTDYSGYSITHDPDQTWPIITKKQKNYCHMSHMLSSPFHQQKKKKKKKKISADFTNQRSFRPNSTQTLSPKRAEKEYKVSISGPSPHSHAASKFSRSLLKVKACGFTFPSSVCQLEPFTCPNPTTRNKLNPICQKCDKNTHKILSERMMRDFFFFFLGWRATW